MSSRTVIVILSLIAVAGAVIASLAGLLMSGGDGPWTFVTHRGQEVTIHGRGLYRTDTLFHATQARGTDLGNLVWIVPITLAGLWRWRQGAIRGGLVLAGGLLCLAYVYASYAMAAVDFNDLFLVYVVTLGASFWGMVLVLADVDRQRLEASLAEDAPRRSIAWFLLIVGPMVAAIWFSDPITSLITGELPIILDTNRTLFTHALDSAILGPAIVFAGVLIWQGRSEGYLLAFPLTVLCVTLLPLVSLQTVFQVRGGVEFNLVQIVVMIGAFLVMAGAGMWALVTMWRDIREPV